MTFNPSKLKYEFKEFIGIYENAFTLKECEDTIKLFENYHKSGYSYVRENLILKDDISVSISPSIELDQGPEFINSFHDRLYNYLYPLYNNQYKTCWRNDTQFWIDHKNVKCDFYDQIIDSMYYVPIHLLERHEYMMFFLTTAGKDIQWKSKVKQKPFPVQQLDTKTIHHLEYIQSFYE